MAEISFQLEPCYLDDHRPYIPKEKFDPDALTRAASPLPKPRPETLYKTIALLACQYVIDGSKEAAPLLKQALDVLREVQDREEKLAKLRADTRSTRS